MKKPRVKAGTSKSAAAEPKKPPGRPSTFTKELADRICERLAAGETLRAACRGDDMPPEATVRNWAVSDVQGFAAQYTHAREIGYHSMADELVEIADDGTNDSYKDDDGHVRVDQDVIARSRLRVDTRKWLLSKALPKVYGDKLAIEAVHHHDASNLTDAELAAIVAGGRRERVAETPNDKKRLH